MSHQLQYLLTTLLRHRGVGLRGILFRNGESGALFDANVRSSLFSDAAGTTLAVVDGEVLHQKDVSGNGLTRTGTLGNGPILRRRADGVHYLDFAGGKTLTVPTSTALFKFLHDGTGGTLLGMIQWPGTSAGSSYITTCASTAQVGIQITKSATTQTIIYNVNRGVSGQQSVTTNISRFALSTDINFFAYRYSHADAADDCIGQINSGRTKYLQQTIADRAPSTADSTGNFTVSSGGLPFSGHEYFLAAIGAKLSDDLISKAYNATQRRYYPVPASDYTLLLGGQSNMAGRGTVITTAVEQSADGAFAWTKANEFRRTKVPEHSNVNLVTATDPTDTETSPQHGFALRTQKKLKTDSAINTLIVPGAVGGVSIQQWDTPATKLDRTTLFGALNLRYRDSKTRGGTPVIIWYGHEGNAGGAFAGIDYVNGGVGTTYQTLFADLVANLRSEITESQAPIIFVQLASENTLAVAANQAAAGEAQRQLELSLADAYMVVAHDVRRNAGGDSIHVSREGMDVIGDRVALAFREHILGEAVNGTGPRIVSASWTGSTVTLICDKTLNTTAGNYGDLFRVYDNGVEATVSSADRGTNTSTVEIVCSAPLSGPVTITYGHRAGPDNAARTDFVADSDGLPLPLFGPYVATAV